jgi:hypothetical protein
MFQVSGTPGRHQWLQSMLCPPCPVYIDGWPSFLSCDKVVILSKWTGFDIDLSTFSNFNSAGWWPPGYLDPKIGSFCPSQVVDADCPHFNPLK